MHIISSVRCANYLSSRKVGVLLDEDLIDDVHVGRY